MIQTDKPMMADQPEQVVVDKLQKKAEVIDVTIPSNSDFKKKVHKKISIYTKD